MTHDPHRPTIHFSPPANWMNDPCGLVWHDGVFHLYYQHNPHENRWGPMHWGHAVSEDLFHWRDRPIALFPDDTHGMAFTGSAVCVAQRDLQPGQAHGPQSSSPIGPEPLRAIYTGALPGESIHSTVQQQCLATSTDGERWTPRGVVLPNPGIEDFRDPKVGRHPDTGGWFLVLAAGDHVQFFSSPDLERWRYESSFGHGLGYAEGEWECPDLFELPLPGGGSRWVLVVHVGRGLSNRFAGAQYITGSFDGRRFHPAEEDFRPVDHGHDFYAAQSWSETKQRRIWLAWASHWAHSDRPHTRGWAGTMTLPRELSLIRDAHGAVELCQRPVREFSQLLEHTLRPDADRSRRQNAPAAPGGKRGSREHLAVRWGACSSVPSSTVVSWITNAAAAYRVATRSTEATTVRVVLEFGGAGEVVIERTPTTLRIDRSACDMGSFSAHIDTDKTVPLTAAFGTMEIVFDHSILEVFVDDGAIVTTDLLVPQESLSRITYAVKAGAPAGTCTVHTLRQSIIR